MFPNIQPAAARRRPYVVRLPAARKAAADLMADGFDSLRSLTTSFDDLRASSLPAWEREVRAYLRAQLGRIGTRLGDGERTASALVPESESVLLRETLAPLQLALVDDLVPLVVAELGIAFRLDDPATRDYLRAAGANIAGITETTRAAVVDALVAGQAEGEGIAELARRIRDLPAFGQARATLVSRTELGHSQMEASYASYVASGVVIGLRVLDGDEDAPCAARNGTTLTIEQAAGAPRLLHPQCTAAWAPLTDAADLEASA